MSGQSESQIQSDIVSEFEADPFVVWCMVTTTGRAKLKGYWVTLGKDGIPDIIGQLQNGLMFGYEVKRPGEKPTKDQIEFIDNITSNNGEAGWGCSPLDAVKWLSEVKLRHASPVKKKRVANTNSKRGTRLDEDWELPDDWYQWACESRPDVDVALEADKFKDYWLSKSGAGACKLDWMRTWRNWIRSAFASKRSSNGTYQSTRKQSTAANREWFDQELF